MEKSRGIRTFGSKAGPKKPPLCEDRHDEAICSVGMNHDALHQIDGLGNNFFPDIG
jgi:hypothetical protein